MAPKRWCSVKTALLCLLAVTRLFSIAVKGADILADNNAQVVQLDGNVAGSYP